MLAIVAKRPPKSASPNVPGRLAVYVGSRIREGMERRGWVTDDGKHEVTRLQEAVAEAGGLKPGQPRWQTVQEWVEGKTAPSTRYATLIARALDMTLAELMGVATKEPVYPAWQRFLETPQGQSMSEAERQSLASLLWVHGPPDIAAYKMALAAIRSTSEG